MAEIPLVKEELENDLSKLRNILGYESQELLSEDDYSADDDLSDEGKFELTEDEVASGSSSGQYILPENCSPQNPFGNILDNSDNKLELLLALNQTHQHQIIDLIFQFEDLVVKIKAQQKKLLDEAAKCNDKEKSGSTKAPKCYTSRTYSLFEAPYFKDINGRFAPPNEDTETKIRNKEINAYVVPCKLWTDAEKESLETAVALSAQEKLLNPLLVRKQVLSDKLKNKDLSESDYDAESAKLQETIYEINSIKNKPKEECIGQRGFDVDWMKISAIGLDDSRSPEECKLMWNSYLHPSINKEEWTEREDDNLKCIARKNKFFDWDRIAEKLGTDRTSWQCLRRWQQKINKATMHGRWSKHEDELLRRIVEVCRSGDYIPWHQVAYYLDGRTRSQIQSRWERCICPDLKKGTWTVNEDVILLAAVKKHGIDWTKVCKYLPGRNNTQCRERYKNTLEECITIAQWTPEEDVELLRLVKKYGEGKWAQIAKAMNGRTDNSISQRFHVLQSKKPDVLDYVDPNRTPDVDVIPHTIGRTGQYSKANKRRQEVYEALNSKNINLNTQEEKDVHDNAGKANGNEFLGNKLMLLRYNRKKIRLEHRRRIKSPKDNAADAALDEFLAPIASLPTPFGRPRCMSMTGVENVHAVRSKLFLAKMFKCDSEIDEEVDIPNKSLKYFEKAEEDIKNVFRHLVIGRQYEDTDSVVPAIPPNKATLGGFKLILCNRKRLLNSAKKLTELYVIPILTAKSSDSVQCLKCLSKSEPSSSLGTSHETEKDETKDASSETCERTAEDSSGEILSAPKKQRTDSGNNTLIEKCSHKDEMPENCHSTQKMCLCCERMKTFHQDFQLLKTRFLSTFFWPALLSTMETKYSQCPDEIYENEAVNEQNSTQKPKSRWYKKKKVQKKPWVTKCLKKRHLEKNHTLRDPEPKRTPIKKGKYKIREKNIAPTRRSARHISKAVIDV